MKKHVVAIAAVYVPVKRAKTLEPAKVTALAEEMLAAGQKMPILVRPDGGRFVLVEGLHRLEALRSLGASQIEAYLVQARLH